MAPLMGHSSGTSGRASVAVLFMVGAMAVGLVAWFAMPANGSDEDGALAHVPVLPPDHESSFARDDLDMPLRFPPELAEAMDLEPLFDVVAEIDVAEVPPDANFEHVGVPGNRSRMFVAPQYFEEKYRNASLEDIEAAKQELSTVVKKWMNDEAVKFVEAGRAETHVMQRPDDSDVVKPDAGSKDGLIAFTRSEVLSDGSLMVKNGRLPWEEYVPLYDAKDELLWLMKESHQRRRALGSGLDVAAADGDGAPGAPVSK